MRHWTVRLFVFIGLILAAVLAASAPQSDFSVEPGAPFCENSWPYQLKIGHFHVHTLLSRPPEFQEEGLRFNLGEYDHAASRSPDEMLTVAARRHINFLGFSDHAENLLPGAWLLLGDYEQCVAEPIALRGCEWTDGGALWGTATTNHLAIYGTTRYVGTRAHRTNWDGVEAPKLNILYPWLNQQSDNWFAAFCHPWVGRSHFHNFDYPAEYPNLIKRMALIEVGGGPNPLHQTSLAGGEEYYRLALSKGWRVAPIIGVDNFRDIPLAVSFSAAWVSGGYSPVEALREAILARRVYAITNFNPIDLRFAARSAAGIWAVAGSTVCVTSNQPLTLAVHLAEPREPRWVRVLMGELRVTVIGLARNGKIKSQVTLPPNDQQAWTVNCRPDADLLAYYLQVRLRGYLIALSAPIWVERQAGTEPTTPVQPAVTTVAQPLIMESRRVRPPWVPPTNPPDDYLSYPPISINWIRVPPRSTARVYVTRRADWTQGVRISLDEIPVWFATFPSDGMNRRTELTNTTNFVQDYALEAFHRQPSGRWYRTTDSRLTYDNREGGRLIRYEDGCDTDFDDLIVELR